MGNIPVEAEAGLYGTCSAEKFEKRKKEVVETAESQCLEGRREIEMEGGKEEESKDGGRGGGIYTSQSDLGLSSSSKISEPAQVR